MSIISHDKMRFLLEDIDRHDWGVEVDALDITDRLEAMLGRIETAPSEIHADIASVQDKVWTETRANLEQIGREQFGINM